MRADPRPRGRDRQAHAGHLDDGEVCIFDQQLISRLEWLRERPKDQIATPPIFMVFDCLWLAGRDLREQDLRSRRDQLEQVLDGQDVLSPARRLAEDGLKGWARVVSAAAGVWLLDGHARPHPYPRSHQKAHVRFMRGLK